MPPPPPVPVPSKAAIRALRGLVLGTTCSLALVAEDRRRRINAAHSAIRNARSIRSASRYHASGSALAIALEEESFSSAAGEPAAVTMAAVTMTTSESPSIPQRPETREPSSHDDLPTTSHPPIRRYIHQQTPTIADKAQEYQSRTRPAHHFIQQQQQQQQPSNGTAAPPADAPAPPSEPPHRRHPAPWLRQKTDDEIAVKALLGTLVQACKANTNPSTYTNTITNTTKPDDVQDTAPAAGEDDDIRIPETGAHHDPFVHRFQRIVSRFVKLLTASPSTPSSSEEQDLINMGRPLLDCLFTLEHRPSIKAVYAAIVARCPSGLDLFTFSYWFIRKLDKAGYHALVVSSFLARPPAPDALPNWLAYFNLCDRVVEATRRNYYRDADKVLATLRTTRPPTSRLKTPWVTDLLYGHWSRTRRFADVRELFDSLTTPTDQSLPQPQPLRDVVNHVDAAYRVMVQIALEAGEPAAAQSLFDALVALEPAARGDVRILGLFALQSARTGDWPAVQAFFQKRTALAAAAAHEAERVLVPIVQEHMRHHAIAETEAFLKMCISDLGIPISRQLVTLVANKYGALRDVRTFIDWLWYCATSAGFTVDAAFSNAILQNCRKHWKFSFRDLRTLYRKLKVLSPDFEDRVTQTIMMHAAISDAKHTTGRPVKGRVLSLRIRVQPAGAKAAKAANKLGDEAVAAPPALVLGRPYPHYADEHELFVAMKLEFMAGFPAKAVRIYKHAMRAGMPPSSRCLCLAVGAAIRIGKDQARPPPAVGDDDDNDEEDAENDDHEYLPPAAGREFDGAIELIQSAHAAGHDIGDAMAYLAIAYIDAVGPQSHYGHMYEDASQHRGKASVATAVKAILARLDAHSSVNISGLAFNRAAFHLYKASHLRGALALAKSAAATPTADGGGGGAVGYNVYNFALLVAVYARLADAEGIRTVTWGAVRTSSSTGGGDGGGGGGSVIAHRIGYQVLKQSKRRLQAALRHCEALSVERSYMDTDTDAHHTIYRNEARRIHKANLQAALAEVDHALDLARAARQKLAVDRAVVDAGAVEVMQQAAKDAGREPVDFAEIPYLRRAPPAEGVSQAVL